MPPAISRESASVHEGGAGIARELTFPVNLIYPIRYGVNNPSRQINPKNVRYLSLYPIGAIHEYLLDQF
jgi:hypothetical protein